MSLSIFIVIVTITLFIKKMKILIKKMFLRFLELYINEKEVDEAYKKEVERNVKFLKIIAGVAIICFFNMPIDQAVYVVGSIVMSEGLDFVVLKWKEWKKKK